jgi:hypothetical protein
MTSGKREDTEIRKKKHWIAFAGEVALEEAMGLSHDRLRNE